MFDDETTMVMFRWALTAVLASMALLVDVGNAAAPVLSRRRRRNVSMVPLFGAIFGTGACLICPLDGAGKLIPIAILVDPSVVSLVVFGMRWIVDRSPR